MEILGVFVSVEHAAEAVKRLITSGISETHITSVTSVPYPDGVLTKVREKPRFYLWTLVLGAGGALLGFALAAGTAWLYPVQTGDKPIISIFPVGLITYEFMMLFAIIGTLIGMFRCMHLPDFRARAYAEQIADGAIGILVTRLSQDQLKKVKEVLSATGAEELCVEEVKE